LSDITLPYLSLDYTGLGEPTDKNQKGRRGNIKKEKRKRETKKKQTQIS
jgi:hypothetical protein